VVHALAGAGASEVVVVNRTPERAEAAAALAGGAGRVGTSADLERVELVVNATPLGLSGRHAGADALPIDPRLLGPDQLLVDLVPNPAVTPLMRAAGQRGTRVAGGLGMLVHQGAAAFELWTGLPAPIAVMRAAAARALG
jgi:shikimate dehydrogenase